MNWKLQAEMLNMKKDFTTAEMNYLKWLCGGHACSEHEYCDDCQTIYVLNECFIDEQIIYSKELPFKPDRRALRSLKKAGMLEEHPEYHLGLNWCSIWLSEKARKFMEGLS